MLYATPADLRERAVVVVAVAVRSFSALTRLNRVYATAFRSRVHVSPSNTQRAAPRACNSCARPDASLSRPTSSARSSDNEPGNRRLA